MPIVLAGPETPYHREAVAPHVDGREVRWIGPIDAQERNALLGGAAALLYPLTEPEPFGLVKIEAMLCATPVAATSIGAVPEIVEPGVSGCLAGTPDALAGAVRDALRLDRARSRRGRSEVLGPPDGAGLCEGCGELEDEGLTRAACSGLPSLVCDTRRSATWCDQPRKCPPKDSNLRPAD